MCNKRSFLRHKIRNKRRKNQQLNPKNSKKMNSNQSRKNPKKWPKVFPLQKRSLLIQVFFLRSFKILMTPLKKLKPEILTISSLNKQLKISKRTSFKSSCLKKSWRR